MSSMTDCDSAEEFEGSVRNPAGMTESQYHNATNIPPGALTGTDSTSSKTLSGNIDPRLLALSKANRTIPKSGIAPDRTDQSRSRKQSTRNHAHTHRIRAHDRVGARVTKLSTRNPPSQFSAQSDSTKEQKVKPSPQRPHRSVSNNDASNHRLHLPSQPQKTKQRKPHAWRDKAAKSAAAVEVQSLPEIADPDEESDSMVGSDNRIRWMDGVMEWWDDKDLQWRPARYHRDCRDELIALAAQQPGAPFWTEVMGTNYTSFSPLTQGWTKDPSSVVDSKGRQVFLMEKRPSDWNSAPIYGHLFHNGRLLLSHKDRPIRDIPGLPLTIDTEVPGWFLEGLRRCLSIGMNDFMARSPGTRQTKSGCIKPLRRATTFTQRIRRWLHKKSIKQWPDRQRVRKAKQPFAAKHDLQGPETVRTQHEPPAELDIGLGERNTHLFNDDPHLSAEISYGQASNPDGLWVGAGTHTSVDEDASLSSWETSTLVNLGGNADTGHLPISQWYNSASGFQHTPADSNCRFDGERHGIQQVLEGCSFDHETPQLDYSIESDMLAQLSGVGSIPRADNHSNTTYKLHHGGSQSTASPVLRSPDLDCNQAYNFGYESTYPQPMNAILPNTASSLNVAPEFITHYPEIPSEPQSYNSQTYPTSTTTNTDHFFNQPGSTTDPMNTIFPNISYSPIGAP